MWTPNNSDPVLEFLSEKLSISDFLGVFSTDESVVVHVSAANSDVHDLLIYLNSPDETSSTWSCPSIVDFLQHPTPWTNSLVPFFLFDFYQFLIGLLKSDSLLLSPVLFLCMMFSSKHFEESMILVVELLSCNRFRFLCAAHSGSFLVTSLSNNPPSIRITSGVTCTVLYSNERLYMFIRDSSCWTSFERSNKSKSTGSFLDKILISAAFSTGNSRCPGIECPDLFNHLLYFCLIGLLLL